MKILILIVFILFHFSQVLGQNQTYTSRYDLQFMNMSDTTSIQNWRFDVVSMLSCIMTNSIEKGRRYLRFWHPKEFPFTKSLVAKCEQRILLPFQIEKRGKVSLTSKGTNIEYSRLIIRGLNKFEDVLYIDTLQFKSDSTVNTISAEFFLSGIELLDIKIEAEGFKKQEASFFISKVDISLGERTIDAFPLKEFNQKIDFCNDKIIPLHFNSSEGFERIEGLKKKRIIGIGESVHGNTAIANTLLHLVQHQVLQNKCRLVMSEIPMELSLYCNRYIQDKSFEFEEKFFLGSELGYLLDWLRDYNVDKQQKDRVVLLGTDFTYVRELGKSTASDLFDYLALLNETVQSAEIDALLVSLLEESWEKSIFLLKQRREQFEKLLSPMDYMCISHIFNLSHSVGYDRDKRITSRDSVMFENAKFLIDQFCPLEASAIITGHSVHLNLLSCYPTTISGKTFGFMMNNYYKDDFYSITVQIGAGGVFLPNIKGVKGCWELSDSPDSSIERRLSEIDQEVFFAPVPESFDKLILSRFIGQTFSKQGFYPLNLYRRHHGMIFIRDAGYNINREDRSLFLDGIDKYMKRTKERFKLLECIKKRMK